MKITNPINTTITSTICKVIETGKGFLINSQYYSKETLSPIPFESVAVYGGDTYTVNTSKRLFLQGNSSYIDTEDRFNIVKDSNITLYPNRYYVYLKTGYYNSTSDKSRILVFDEVDGEIHFIHDREIHRDGSYNYIQVTEYLGQDDEYIYFTSKRDESPDTGNTYCQIWDLRKSDFVFTRRRQDVNTVNNIMYKKVCETNDCIYMNLFSENSAYIVGYDRNTRETWISSGIKRNTPSGSSFNNYRYTNIPDDSYKIDSTHYGTFIYNPNNTIQPLDIYIINTDNNEFTAEHCNITWGSSITEFPFVHNSTKRSIYRNFISEFDNIKYLNIYVYQEDYSASNYIPIQGIYTFKIVDKNTLVFQSRNSIDDSQCIGGFIYDDAKEHLIVAKINSFQILKFNKIFKKYECTGDTITNCYSVGLDELNRVWYIKTDTSAHMVNLEDAQSVNITYEKPYYDYIGSPINTYINFSAINYLGVNFSGNFKLTIDGPAIFTENNSNVLIFHYNGTGEQEIGIVITGASPVTIYPYFIN